MEAFESFVAIALESEGFVVSEAVKFPVTRSTRKKAHAEVQTHGFEVDLVGARADRLVLATVKSFFGSRGVVSDHVTGETTSEDKRLYALLNDVDVRRAVMKGAASRYGYRTNQIQLRLYVGRFAAPTRGTHEEAIRKWAAKQRVGAGPIEVYGVAGVVNQVQEAASHKQYRDNAVLVTMKVLQEAGRLNLALPDDIGAGEDD